MQKVSSGMSGPARQVEGSKVGENWMLGTGFMGAAGGCGRSGRRKSKAPWKLITCYGYTVLCIRY